MAEADQVVDVTITGGSGLHSYAKNSNFQRKAIDSAKQLINKAVAETLDLNIFASSNTFGVADLGCAAGPNTFFAVQNIIDAVELKCQRQLVPEFQVFFNDQPTNDFNQLFASLPAERRYLAAGVPGSFHERLFPTASLHFVHSSYSFQALSKVPIEVLDRTSPAWNKGRIHYSNAKDEVVECFKAHYVKDMNSIFRARAQEIAHGGLMAFIVPGRPDGTPHSDVFINKATQLLGSCLVDLANKGKISEEKLDSFNMPTYVASPVEVETIVKQNGFFNVEMLDSFDQEKPQPKVLSSTMRAGLGGLIKNHFGLGEEILEELFDLLLKKFEDHSSFIFESGNSISLFVLLKRVNNK